MLEDGCKAIVIACNTATSAAAATLRSAWPHVPIIGIEPALKPAARTFDNRRILVMATAATLKLEKFHDLALHWGSNSQIVPLACPGLADLVETGELDSDEMHAYLREHLGEYRAEVDAVVLGCTHYSFIKRQIREVMGDVPLFDGIWGTAHQLRRKLAEHDLLAPERGGGAIQFRSSIAGRAQVDLYRRLYSLPTD